MSIDLDSSSHSGDYKYFRHITRDRLLHKMLGSTKKGDSPTWKVLIMDKFTIKIMSYACKMTDIAEAGVSLVEDIYKRRQSLPTMDAISFIQPSWENATLTPFFLTSFTRQRNTTHLSLSVDLGYQKSIGNQLSILKEEKSKKSTPGWRNQGWEWSLL